MDIIEKLKDIYYKPAKSTENFLQAFIYEQNDYFFDIFSKKPVFNVLNLLKINYFISSKGEFYLENELVDKINNNIPTIALSEYKKEYIIKYKNNIKITKIKYPEIINTQINKVDYNYNIIQNNTVYIKVKSFETINYDILKKYRNKYLILDLRNNSGGKINFMLLFLYQFIKKELFYLKNKNSKFLVKSPNKTILEFEEIIIIVNEKTASSAEIFVNTMKELYKCKVIGNRTYGKWLVHEIISYKQYFIKVPKYKYISLNGNTFNNFQGIIPDIIIDDNRIDKLLSDLIY